MAKNKKRVVLTLEEKLCKAVQVLFVLHARQIDMSNKEIRELLGGDQAEIDAVAKVINKAIKRYGKKVGK
ncbi:TPA: hypothetical protein DEP58_05035 [Patescibacteria group bacterium]|nr:MAG: hypothetical protein UU98_C0008G0025 [Parcubacteria group bacterium GW2011_GWD2_42_14]HCC05630.1 hypothetical protein [Patescibacteria group bacterium]